MPITSATITVEVDDVSRHVTFTVQGGEGRARHIAEYVLEKLAAHQPESYLGSEDFVEH